MITGKDKIIRKITSIKNRSSILSSIKEYDKVGKDNFLNKYGYKDSRKYYLSYNGKEYDSKAIVGVAFQYEYPTEPYLQSTEFSGGKNTVVKLLNSFDFIVTEKSIVNSVIDAFNILNKESSINELKELMIKRNLYDFGAQEDNISDVIRNQIERHSENVTRKDSIDPKYFIKIETNFYKLSKYTVIVENDVSQWDDQTGKLYHFPPQYQKFLQPGTKVIYYKGNIKDKQYSKSRLSDKAHYFAIATIDNVFDDPNSIKNDKYATIKDFELFREPILSKTDDGYLEPIPKAKKDNYWRNGVRPISEQTYLNITSNSKNRIILRKIKRKKIEVKNDQNLNEFESRSEGKKKQIYTTVYERNPQLRQDAIDIHGTTCIACNFNFEEKYGDYAKDFIHIHHVKPLFENEDQNEILINPEKDLVPVCPNCHAVIHKRKDKTLSIEELKVLITKI